MSSIAGVNSFLIIGIVETLIVITCIASVLWHALWLRRQDRLCIQVTVITTDVLYEYFESGVLTDEMVKTLSKLRPYEQIRLFLSMSGMFSGRERDLLRDLAERLGLLRRAERRCHSHLWARRLEGIRLFMLFGAGTERVPAMFDDRHEAVRAGAAEWAADHPSAHIADRLLQLLGDDSALCRFTVKDSLLRIGTAAAPALVNRLSMSDPSEEALEIAVWISDASFMPAALRLRTHPSAPIRMRAVELIASLGGDSALQAATQATIDMDATVRVAAFRALGRLDNWRSGAVILVGLSDAEWDVRKEAALALDALGPAGTLLLRRSLKSTDPSIVDMARHVLDMSSQPQVAHSQGNTVR